MEVREPVFPPEKFLESCEPSFESRKVKHIIEGLDLALRQCDAQIDGIVEWKKEMKGEEEEK